MLKSDVKTLIRAIITEVLQENNETRLPAKERRKIEDAILASKVLGGNQRVEKKEIGLRELTNVLGSLGYSLDMVSGDDIMGDKNTRLLPFRKENDTKDPYFEYPAYSDCRISFTWEKLRANGKYQFEILAYLT